MFYGPSPSTPEVTKEHAASVVPRSINIVSAVYVSIMKQRFFTYFPALLINSLRTPPLQKISFKCHKSLYDLCTKHGTVKLLSYKEGNYETFQIFCLFFIVRIIS